MCGKRYLIVNEDKKRKFNDWHLAVNEWILEFTVKVVVIKDKQDTGYRIWLYVVCSDPYLRFLFSLAGCPCFSTWSRQNAWSCYTKLYICLCTYVSSLEAPTAILTRCKSMFSWVVSSLLVGGGKDFTLLVAFRLYKTKIFRCHKISQV